MLAEGEFSFLIFSMKKVLTFSISLHPNTNPGKKKANRSVFAS